MVTSSSSSQVFLTCTDLHRTKSAPNVVSSKLSFVNLELSCSNSSFFPPASFTTIRDFNLERFIGDTELLYIYHEPRLCSKKEYIKNTKLNKYHSDSDHSIRVNESKFTNGDRGEPSSGTITSLDISNYLEQYIHHKPLQNIEAWLQYQFFPFKFKPIRIERRNSDPLMRNSNYPNPNDQLGDVSGNHKKKKRRVEARYDELNIFDGFRDNPRAHRDLIGSSADDSVVAGLRTVANMIDSDDSFPLMDEMPHVRRPPSPDRLFYNRNVIGIAPSVPRFDIDNISSESGINLLPKNDVSKRTIKTSRKPRKSSNKSFNEADAIKEMIWREEDTRYKKPKKVASIKKSNRSDSDDISPYLIKKLTFNERKPIEQCYSETLLSSESFFNMSKNAYKLKKSKTKPRLDDASGHSKLRRKHKFKKFSDSNSSSHKHRRPKEYGAENQTIVYIGKESSNKPYDSSDAKFIVTELHSSDLSINQNATSPRSSRSGRKVKKESCGSFNGRTLPCPKSENNTSNRSGILKSHSSKNSSKPIRFNSEKKKDAKCYDVLKRDKSPSVKSKSSKCPNISAEKLKCRRASNNSEKLSNSPQYVSKKASCVEKRKLNKNKPSASFLTTQSFPGICILPNDPIFPCDKGGFTRAKNIKPDGCSCSQRSQREGEYNSSSKSPGYPSEETTVSIGKPKVKEEPCEVRYAQTVISVFDDYTIYEVLRSTNKKPKNMSPISENVFVVKS